MKTKMRKLLSITLTVAMAGTIVTFSTGFCFAADEESLLTEQPPTQQVGTPSGGVNNPNEPATQNENPNNSGAGQLPNDGQTINGENPTDSNTNEVVIVIKGKTFTDIFDGTTKTVNGYDVEISNKSYKSTDFSFAGNSVISEKNAGTYLMGLQESQFRNNSTSFNNVRFEVTDGFLTINKRNLVITTASATKVHDGNPLTANEKDNPANLKVEGLAPVDMSSFFCKVTGKITGVGTAINVAEYGANISSGDIRMMDYHDGFMRRNYNIIENFGELRITATASHIATVPPGTDPAIEKVIQTPATTDLRAIEDSETPLANITTESQHWMLYILFLLLVLIAFAWYVYDRNKLQKSILELEEKLHDDEL